MYRRRSAKNSCIKQFRRIWQDNQSTNIITAGLSLTVFSTFMIIHPQHKSSQIFLGIIPIVAAVITYYSCKNLKHELLAERGRGPVGRERGSRVDNPQINQKALMATVFSSTVIMGLALGYHHYGPAKTYRAVICNRLANLSLRPSPG